MSPKHKVSLNEIAERAGVTRMAVSLALRGKPGVSDDTRKSVVRIAAELGYEPDPEVARLMAHIRSKAAAGTKACLALLTSGGAPDEWKRYATERKYVEGARARAQEYGYRLEEFWLNEPGMTAARLSNIIWHRGIEGVVIAPLQGRLSAKAPRTVELDFNLFSAVEISETVEWPDLDRANHDQYTSMMRLLHELQDLNYHRIGLVLEEALDVRVNGRWTAAFLQFRHTIGSKQMPPPLILALPQQNAFDRWYDHHQPDVIISVNRFGLSFIEQRGLKIPGDVAYASLDLDGDLAKVPGMSGIDQNSPMVGAAAIDMLVGSVQRGQRGPPIHPLRMEVEGTWVAGKTAPRRRPPSKR